MQKRFLILLVLIAVVAPLSIWTYLYLYSNMRISNNEAKAIGMCKEYIAGQNIYFKLILMVMGFRNTPYT